MNFEIFFSPACAIERRVSGLAVCKSNEIIVGVPFGKKKKLKNPK